MIEQEQQVKENLFNRWESSKAKVLQGMINQYLKKYEKFKKINDNIAQSKEFAYLKKNLCQQLQSLLSSVTSQQKVFNQIDENMKQKVNDINQIKNNAMKTAIQGLNMAKEGQERIVKQQLQFDKSYDKLTKVVFPDWKAIDSFDEISWLSSQEQINIE